MTSSRVLSLLALAAVLSACSSVQTGEPPPHKSSSAGATAVAPAAGERVAAQPATARTDFASPPVPHSVYFAFDRFDLTTEAASVVQINGDYLMSHPTMKARVEGHSDERGGREYNLALGQRRAEAVVRGLGAMGVRGQRVEAVSFGEERPVDRGHDESAWARNRRADILIGR